MGQWDEDYVLGVRLCSEIADLIKKHGFTVTEETTYGGEDEPSGSEFWLRREDRTVIGLGSGIADFF